MQKIISCGGFRYNSNDFIEENGELKLKNSGGGGSSNVLIVHGTLLGPDEGNDGYLMTIDKTLAEIEVADYSVLVMDFDGVYELPEVLRNQSEGTLAGVTWAIAGYFLAQFNGQGHFEIMESESPIVTVFPTLGTGNEGVYPVTDIDKTYDEIDDADMAYAEVFPTDLGATFKLPFVLKQTTPNYIQLIFSASAAQSDMALTLSFSDSTHEFDTSASAFSVK